MDRSRRVAGARSAHSTLFIVLLLSLPMAVFCAESKPLLPYASEAEAAAHGRHIDVGSAMLEGPREVEVYTHQTWTLVYTAGRAGIQPGGGIRIAMRHVPCWTNPQIEDASAPGYLTAQASNGASLDVSVEYDRSRFFEQYHPWQNIVAITLPEGELERGESLRLVYGDRRGGSPGIRVQPFDESPFVFKMYVDPLGNDDYLPMTDNPKVEVVAAAPHRMALVMPSDAVADEPTWCIVRIEDRYGNPAAGYRGRVRLTSSDAETKLPPEYAFTSADRGVHRFEKIVFNKEGSSTLTAEDREFARSGNPVRVAQAKPERLLLWGDIHGHTLHSDGRGTVEQFYDFGERVAGLDFCAVSDHAFETLEAMWEHSKKVTNRVYKPGRFVTFQAYEWSGKMDVGGDHNVYFLDDDPPLYRSRSYYNYTNFQMYHGLRPQVNHVEDLYLTLAELMKDGTVLCIPHWGGRHGNPKWHNPKIQRMIEVFSEHRRSEDWMTEFLEKGYRLGVMASTDGHYGNPGYGYLKPTYKWDTQEIGMALMAVYAEERTRESIFRAMYDRHVYATSGERIVLEVRADGHLMGSEYTTRKRPELSIRAVGTAPIERVEIKKNSEIVAVEKVDGSRVELQWEDPEFDADETSYYYVRVVQTDGEEAISSPIWVN